MTESSSSTIAQLRRTFGGPIHVPGDAGYDRERATFGGRLDTHPLVVVEAETPRDVQAAVLAARDHGVPFAVQSTGHGTHVACDGGILLKTGGLGGVLVDAERRIARVAAGVRWSEVLTAAEPFGLVPLCGDAPDVGVVGYTLGGGLSWLSRAFGFAADSVVRADVVTADGRMLRVDARRHPELYWALRGGGGNFAIVTALELRLHRVPRVASGVLRFPRSRAAELLAAYTTPLPEATGSMLVVQPDAVELRILHAGTLDAARGAIAPLVAAGGAPLSDTLAVSSFAAARMAGVPPRHFELLRDVPVEPLLAAAERSSAVAVRQWGGAMADPGPGAGPVGHRGVPFSVTIDGGPDAAAPLADHVTGGTFLNFTGDQRRTRSAYTGANLARLRAVKRTWDPENVLGRSHNLTPARAAMAA